MLFMCCIPFRSVANNPQHTKSFKHELGVSLINFSYYYGEYKHFESNRFTSYGNGLFYKYHFGNAFAIRLTTIMHRKNFELPTDINRLESSERGWYYIGNHKSKDLRIGMEKEFGTGKLIPFVAVDFQYVNSVEIGMEIYYMNEYGYVSDRSFRHKLEAFGAGTFLGLKYELHPRVTLSSELGIVFQRNFYSNWTNNSYLFNRRIVNHGIVLPSRLLNLAFKF